MQIERAVLPRNCNSNLELAQQVTTQTVTYRRPVHKLAMLLAADEVPESCQLHLEEPPPEPT